MSSGGLGRWRGIGLVIVALGDGPLPFLGAEEFISPTPRTPTIAVMDFTAYNLSESGAVIAGNAIRDTLVKSGQMAVMERSAMGQILKEQAFQRSGCTTTACLVQMGKILNIRYMVFGEVTWLGKQCLLSARVVDVESGRITISEVQRVTSERELGEAGERLALVIGPQIVGGPAVKGFEREEERPVCVYGMWINFPGIKPLNEIGSPEAPSTSMVGVGVRYVLWSGLMLDASHARQEHQTFTSGSVNFLHQTSSRNFNAILGLGLMQYLYGMAGGAAEEAAKWLIVSPRAGVEWRPRPSIGLGAVVSIHAYYLERDEFVGVTSPIQIVFPQALLQVMASLHF